MMPRQRDESQSRKSLLKTIADEIPESAAEHLKNLVDGENQTIIAQTTAPENPNSRRRARKRSTKNEQKPRGRSVRESEQSGDDVDALEYDNDEEEEELERLVLGDDGGFKAGLSMDMDMDVDMDESENSEDHDLADEEVAEEGGLENLDDADVRTPKFATHLRRANDVEVILS
jgi:hypothetical protein